MGSEMCIRDSHKRLPRAARVFAWQLLHGGLLSGGSLVHMLQHAQLPTALCPCIACAALSPRPLATLHHVFMQCPVGSSALRWLCQLWGRIEQGAGPAFVPSLLLADSWHAWQPRQHLQGLWVLLRVTMLRRIWLAYSAARDGEASAFTPAAVRGAFVAEVRDLIQQDWLRVGGDLRQLSGVCPAWLRGRDSTMALPQFTAAWCVGGVLARVEPAPAGAAAGRPQLRMCLSVDSA